MRRLWLVALVLALVPAAPASAQEELEAGALLLIMDASGSMNAVDETGTRLLDGAKAALNRVVDELPDGTPVGCGSTAIARPTPTRSRAARTAS